MAPGYRELLEEIRLFFPKPVSDRVHDSYFVHSIMRALDLVDDLKSARPILGEHMALDDGAAQSARLPLRKTSVEEVTADLVERFLGMPIWGHPRAQQNVVPPPSIAALIGTLLASLYNPNLAWDDYSHGVARSEVEVVAMMAALVGYDPERAGGLFTFGGTGTTLYGVKLGVEKAQPGAMRDGVREEMVIFASDCSHYSRYNIAGWLGLGTASLRTIPTTTANAMKLDLLRQEATAALEQGKKIAAFIVTLGSTDAFGMDDLPGVVALRDELVEAFTLPYRPHIHADAVIGWAWRVFTDYDFDANPLRFRPRTVRALASVCRACKQLHLADSLGVDFHKTGFAPYISSLFLLKDRKELALLGRTPEQMPYLYQFGQYRPGMYTLETSRAGTGVLAALANLRLFGREGMQAILGHLVEMTQLLREHLDSRANATVLNRENDGTVTLFRVYPDGVDTFQIADREMNDPAARDELLKHNAYNRRLFDDVHAEAMAGRGVLISLTDCYRLTAYGEPILALKSFILSPFIDEESVTAVVAKLLEACTRVSGSL